MLEFVYCVIPFILFQQFIKWGGISLYGFVNAWNSSTSHLAETLGLSKIDEVLDALVWLNGSK